MKSFTIITILSIISFATAAINRLGYQYPKQSLSYQSQYVEPAETIKSVIRNDHMGNYVYGFETSDGIVQRQAGEANGSKRGYYSYIGPDGKTYTVCYIADELGYRIVGNPMLGAIKEIQCPYDTDKRRPVPFERNGYAYDKPEIRRSGYAYDKPEIRRNGYGYDKPIAPFQIKNIYPVPGTDPYLPPYY